MHKDRCILNTFCKISGTKACTKICPHYIGMHGMSGKGGRVKNANIPKDYQLITVKDSPVRDSQEAIYQMIDSYVKTFDRQFDPESKRIKSLFLFSENPGTGKTTTAAATLNEFLVSHHIGNLARGSQAEQLCGYFLDVNELQTLYNEFARSNIPREVAERASREYYRRLDSAKSAQFAVYDDIGVRSATDGFRGDLHSAINYRTTNGLPTVYTSNLPIEEMERVFDARLYDRMRDQCAVLSFRGGSFRGRR